MKRIIIVTLVFMGVCTSSVKAQDLTIGASRNNELKIDFLQFMIMGNFGVQYERLFKNDQSLGLSANYFNFDNWQGHMDGYSFFAEYRWYLKYESEHKGFFVAPYLKYRYKFDEQGYGYYIDEDGNYKEDYYEYVNGSYVYYDYVDDGYKISKGMAFGISGGYKILLRSNFLFEANIGFGRYIFDEWEYTNEFVEQEDTEYIDWVDMADLKANVSIGWRF